MNFPEINPKILIVGGAAIFSTLVFFIVVFIFLYQKRLHRHLREKQDLENRFQQELLKTQLETQEQTFSQIGEELHDNIGQLLSSTRVLIGITERNLEKVPDTLRTADQTLAKSIQDIRMLSKSLNKEWLHQFNLLHNLQAEVDRINMARTIHVGLQSSVRSLPLNPESQVMLFRIIQEALQNSLKHALPTSITITISLADRIVVKITDDGKGFEIAQDQPAGIGLINMRHRTKLLGGEINWHSPSTGGTEIIITLPVQNQDR